MHLLLSISLIHKSGVNKVVEAWELFPGADSGIYIYIYIYIYFKFPCIYIYIFQVSMQPNDFTIRPTLTLQVLIMKYELELATNFIIRDHGCKSVNRL